MHERHRVEAWVAEAAARAQERGASKVRGLTVLIGEALGFDEGCVRLYFEEMAPGTPLEGCALTLRFVPAALHCPRCRKDFPKIGSSFSCPVCGAEGGRSREPVPCGIETIEFA